MKTWTGNALIAIGALTLGAASTLTPSVYGDDQPSTSTRPSIVIGAGGETAGAGMNLLLRVGFELRHGEGLSAGTQVAPEQLVIAHISGTAAINPTNIGERLPYLDLQVTPIDSQIRLSEEGDTINYGSARFLKTKLGRDVSLDQAFKMTVSVIGVQLGTMQGAASSVGFYAQVAADLLGYKMASHLADLPSFHGVHILGAGAEGGVIFKINQDIRIRVGVGGEADLNWWGTHFESDMTANLTVRAEFTKFLNVFAQASLNGFWDSGNSFFRGGQRILFGIELVY